MVDGATLSAEFTGVAAGKVEAAVTAYDAAGNAAKTVKKSIKLADVTPPAQVVGLVAKAVNNQSGGTLAWEAAADDVGVAQYLVAVDGKTYKSKTTSVKIRKLAPGDYTFTVIAVDKAKNQSVVSAPAVFTVADVIAPKIRKLSAKVAGETALVAWSAADETALGALKLVVDGGAAIDVTGLTSCELDLAAGAHRLRLEVCDAAGNLAAKELAVKVKESKPAVGPQLASFA